MTAAPSAVVRSRWAWLNWPLLLLVGLYRVALSPLMGGHCRFHPSCSRYAREALRTHNPIRGTWLVVRRLLRCQPWGGGGYDPVPPFDPAPPFDSEQRSNER